MDGWMDGQREECMDVWIYRWIDGWSDSCMNDWMCGLMVWWFNRWMNEQIGWIDENGWLDLYLDWEATSSEIFHDDLYYVWPFWILVHYHPHIWSDDAWLAVHTVSWIVQQSFGARTATSREVTYILSVYFLIITRGKLFMFRVFPT
jgi:hypothetical protein